MKGLYDLKNKFLSAGPGNCFISEITLAELKFGVENSQSKEKNTIAISNGLTLVTNNVDHLGRMKHIKIEDWTK